MIEPRRTRAFTLVELLVVVAIIAVLAALLLPVFAKGRAKAAETTCISNLRQLVQAAIIFSHDHTGALPGTDAWAQLQIDAKIFRCPAADAANGYLYNARAAGKGLDGCYLPTETLLFADGGAGDNLGREPGDFDYRHLNHGLIAAYADGHTVRVAQGYAALFYPGDLLASPEEAQAQFGIDVRAAAGAAGAPVLLRELSRYTPQVLAKTPGAPVIAHLILGTTPPGGTEVTYADYGIAGWPDALTLHRAGSGELTLALADTASPPAGAANLRWTLHRGVYYAFRVRGFTIDDGQWSSANPAGFSYAMGSGKSPFPGEQTDGAIAAAGTCSPTEDQATLFSAMMVDPAYVASRGTFDAAIKAKSALLQQRLAADTPALNDDFWRYLTKATAKKPAGGTAPGGKPVYEEIEGE